MVNVMRFGITVFAAVAINVANSYAELPTMDAGNIATSGGIVKNGTQNIGLIDKINGKVSELNTIVGDGAASIAKFQAEYGDEIQKSAEFAQKVKARSEDAKNAKEAHDAEVQEQKDAYQAAMDSLEEAEDQEENTDEEALEEEEAEGANVRELLTSGEFAAMAEEARKSSLMTSDGKVYEDEEEAAEDVKSLEMSGQAAEENSSEDFVDGVPETSLENATLSGAVNTVAIPVTTASGKITVSNGTTIIQNSTVSTSPVVSKTTSTTETNEMTAGTVSGSVEKADSVNEASTPTVQRRKFRVSPKLQKIEKMSSNTFRQSEKMAFASAAEEGEVGNSYIGDVYVVPMAQKCEISPESFINDENVRKKCTEKIIRENNADNSFDSALSMKDCQKMIYNTVVALLAEATQSKYEAANYSDTLDKQDELAGDSTDVRGDLTVVAMSNQQTQLLLNRLSMSFSSQIILETAIQLCAMQKDVLGDSDLDDDEDAQTDGEK